MPGTYQYDVEIKSNVAKLLSDMKQVQDRLDTVEGKEYKIKLNVDEKKLSNVISNLEKMLDSLGKGTGDFKQFENLSKEMSSIVSEVQSLSKAFGKVDDSGAKTLLSSIQNIDKSLSELSQNILNVNKNMSNIGGNTSGAVKQVENISNAYQDAAKEAEKLADVQSKIGQKTNISSGLDSNISKYQEIVSLVKEYYELSQKIQTPKLSYQKRSEDYDRIDGYLLKKAPQKVGTTDIEKDINDRYHKMAKGVNEGSEFAIKAMRSAIQRYWSDVTEMPSDEKLLSSRKVIPYGNKGQKEEYIIPKKYQDMEKSVIQETIAMNKNNIAYEEERKQIEANNSALKERMDLIRNTIKSYDKNPDYNGEYKMGLSLKSSDKGKTDIFSSASSMSQEEMLQEICNMLGVEIPKNADKAKEAIKEVATATTEPKNDAFLSTEATASVEKTTQAIREENNALEETANKAKQAVSELVKSRDVVSQNWYREKGTVVGKDSKGNDITRDADEFSFVERLKNGQLQTVLATYNEETGKWAEQIINVRTAFEQVEKAIISADNKIASLEMTKEKTLAAHPGYDTTADDNQIAIERKKRDELQNTLNLYGQEKEYVFEIEAANKRIADNQERLNNKKQSQTNLRQAVSDEQFLKDLNEAWNSAIKVNNALNETNSLLNSLKIPNGFERSFSTLESEIKRLNSEFGSGKISATEYANSIKKAFSNYQTPIDNRTKDIWNELTTSLDRYATLQKRIASNNALSTDNEEATKLLEHIHELQRNDILPTEKLTASNEKLQQINQTITDLKAKLKESTLDSLQGSIDKYHKIYEQRRTYSSDFTPSEQYTKNLNELETAIGNLVEYKNTLKNVSEVTVEQEAELKRLVTACEKASDSFKSLSASEKGASQIAIDKLVQRINKDLDECTNYSENAKHKLRALREELESANPRNLKEITSEIINIENAEIRAGRAGRTLWDTMKHSGFHQIAAQIAGMVGVYDVINAGKEGINVVRELNTALTEMQKVSDETKQKLKDYQSTTFNTADAVGTTAKQIQTSTADWMRLGESMNQAAASAKDANILLNVSEFNNIDEATESLVSMSQAYKDLDKMDIIDVLNNVGNNYSISTDGLATALQDSASALVTANNDLNEAVALTTAGNAIPQDPSSVGAGMRTISLRLVGTKAAKEELESLGEDTSDVITTTSKLRETILDATKDASADGKGFDILDDNGNYKSTYEIMQGLADLYDDIVKKDKELGTNNLNLLLETIAGEFLPENCGNTFYRTHLIALVA